jgi:hypothetical protein
VVGGPLHSELCTYSKKDQYGDQHAYGLAVKDDLVIEMWIYEKKVNVTAVQSLLVRQWKKL